MSEIMTRVVVTNLTEAVPVYRKLAGGAEPQYVEFPAYRAAVIGPFMVLEGSPAELARYRDVPILVVSNLDVAVQAFTQHGGEVLEGPFAMTGGRHIVVKDADGNTFECLQTA